MNTPSDDLSLPNCVQETLNCLKQRRKNSLIARYQRSQKLDQPITQPDSVPKFERQTTSLEAEAAEYTVSTKLRCDFQLVQTQDQLYAVLQTLEFAKVISIDTETTGLDPFRDKVRLLQLAVPDQPVVIVDLFELSLESREPLKRLLQGAAVKVAHNWKFDWKFLKQEGLEPRGLLFDTMLASQLLTAGLSGKHTLKDVASRYLGIELDKALQVSNWSGQLDSEQLTYAAYDAAILLPLRDVLKARLVEFSLVQAAKVEFAAIPAVAEMELNGMLLNLSEWESMATTMEQERDRTRKALQLLLNDTNVGLSRDCQTSLLPGFNNLNIDSTQQLLAALQDLGIPLKTTSKYELLPLAEKYPVVQALLDYRKAAKSVTAFGSALPKHVHGVTGRLHPTYWQIGATTGRFSCSSPNLQQIPRRKEVRSCFIPAPGCRLVVADYSQIELRIAAEISGDRRMIEAYQQGEDLHRLTAALIAGKAVDQVTSAERQAAKAVNFGLIYAMSAEGLKIYAKNTYGVELTSKQAITFRERFFEAYQELADWHTRVRRDLYKGRVQEARTLINRRRQWNDNPKLTEVLNAPVQGTSADITKKALSLLPIALKGTEAKIIGTIHDEILLETPSDSAITVAQILKDTMEAAGKAIIASVPIEVDVKVTQSWAEK